MKVVYELYRMLGREQTEDKVKKHVTLIALSFSVGPYTSPCYDYM